MADITLADYTGFIFLEIIRAREMADRHSRQLAETYAQDPVLRHFAVPRFKTPKMELTIPVLISGARFNQVISFKMPREKFVAFVLGRLKEVASVVQSNSADPFGQVRIETGVLTQQIQPAVVTKKGKAARPARATAVVNLTPSLETLANEFWDALVANPDPSQPGEVVRRFWARMFEQMLNGSGLIETYKKTNPANELFRKSLDDVLRTVTAQTAVDSTRIQSLLINPETNVVKDGSSDTSVFTLKAEMLEEGFFIRSVRDETTGQTQQVVEFE